MPASESEKHQKSGLHSRFIDRLEHVPIKKRRFLYMSPSSTPQPPLKSACLGDEENTNPSNSQYSLVHSEAKCLVTPDAKLGNMLRDADFQHNHLKINENLQSNKDFSGISILAAAACCSSSLGKEFGYAEDGSGVEEPSTHECLVEVSTNSEAQSSSKGFVKDDLANPSDTLVGGSSSCVTTSIVGELATTSTAEYASGNEKLVEKGFKERSCGDDTPTVSSELSSLKDEEIVGGGKLSSQEFRLHWDLNVVMDAWEQPCEDHGSHTSDPVSNAIGAAVRWDAHKKNDAVYGLLSEAENSTCDDRKLPRVDARRSVNTFEEGNKGISDKCDRENPPSECKRVLTSLVDGLSENLPFLNPLDIKGCANHEYIVESMASNTAPVESDLKNAPGPIMLDAQCAVASVGASAEKHTDVSATVSHMSFSAVPAADMNNEDTLKMEMTGNPSNNGRLCLKDDRNDRQRYVALQVKSDVPLKGDMMEIFDLQRSSCVHELAVASDPRVGSNAFSKNASEKAMTDGQSQVCIGGVTIASAERSEQEFISSACFDPCSRGGNGTDGGELLEDCDSQYEDGELRERTGPPWQEYDAAGGGAEHNRYVMKDIDSHIPESGNTRKSKLGDAAYDAAMSSDHGVGIELCVVPGKPVTDDGAHGKDNVLPKSVFYGVEKMKGPASAELSASNKISQTTVVSNDCDRKVSIYHHGSRSSMSDVSGIGAGSVVYRRGLRSRIEGPVSGHISFGDDRAGNRSKLEGCTLRWERGTRYAEPFERFRHMQNQPRFRPGNGWGDSPGDHRGVKRNCLPSHPLVKPNDDDTSAKGVKDGTLNVVSSSNCPSTDDSSFVDADVTANFRPDPKVGADPGCARLMNREKLLRHDPHIEHRGGRGRYHGLSPEDAFVASLKYRRPLSQRDRSPSPCERRRYLFARQSNGSSSRSRSRSPKPRFSPRGRRGSSNFGGAYGRHKNRSPNFRPEDRMLRMRSPTRQSEFGADHEPGFRTFQRRHHGSLPSPRWINARKDEVDDFSYEQRPIQEKSPGRVRLQCEGENLSAPAQNSKPNVYCRLNGGRLPEADTTDGQPQFEGNYVNRRHFGPINGDRRGCDGSTVKRLHRGEEHGGDDAFVSAGRDVAEFRGGVRKADNRDEDMPRRFRGDNNYMCERNGRFNSSSKRFGFEGMDSLSYKSGDSYRPANSGRFSGMDRAGRGHRYVNSYDDRRRYFGSAERWGDTESMRRQPGHEIDDSLPLAGTSCNEDAADCHGGGTTSADGYVDDQSRGQREERLDLSGQEKKLGSCHPLPADVQAPPES